MYGHTDIETDTRPLTAFDAVVAADADDHVNIITSPTESWIPEFPIITNREITTYADGLWGPQEYTRWPQIFSESIFHHACIPLKGSPDAPADSVYDGFGSFFFTDTALNFDDIYDCETPGFGRMDTKVLTELKAQAELAICKLRAAEAAVNPHTHNRHVYPPPLFSSLGNNLKILLRNAVDRLQYLPCTRAHVLVTGRMAHRLILEIYGLSIYRTVVVHRLANPTPNAIGRALRVRGAFVRNAASAQLLFRLGIPFWFLQRFRLDINIHRVVRPKSWTDDLNSMPVGMKVPKSWYDADGTQQDPARWVHPSLLYVCTTLCSSTLPRLEDVIVSEAPATKRHKGPLGPPSQEKSQCASGSKQKKVRRGGKHRATHPRPFHAAFAYESPPSDILADTPNWQRALRQVSPLPNPPPKAAVYYFPPPFIFTSAGDKLGRYIHNYARIRMFCRQRLLEPHFEGRPLKISEWKHALYGDYRVDDSTATPSSEAAIDQNARMRHEHKQAVRRLFATSAGLASYSEDMWPRFRRDRITFSQAASDRALAREVIWEVNEMNWRCELRALNALIVGAERSEWVRWEQEQAVCGVWQEALAVTGHSALFCSGQSKFCWTPVIEDGWQQRGRNLTAFIRIMSRWPNFPSTLRDRLFTLTKHDQPEEFDRLESIAVDFYVSTFVSQYHRLPCVPLRRLVNPPSVLSASEGMSA
ncbi:uncharacterized protein C8Q71DRAFT_709339 [Rhodofomes roseus]|uniref:Uncharacterized protein n=1 Tax=Rhodofomes roseus TaxID=34475 RepID=A0ABQ8KEB6_9APHY|nr:uncharacterized protein C8Q71DRAFT_709339 [Rhodofomes roseus]KAH9835530.1 hypothetical protein C8Q71DRAFT_709339 [Rhodofomes roseus]